MELHVVTHVVIEYIRMLSFGFFILFMLLMRNLPIWMIKLLEPRSVDAAAASQESCESGTCMAVGLRKQHSC